MYANPNEAASHPEGRPPPIPKGDREGRPYKDYEADVCSVSL